MADRGHELLFGAFLPPDAGQAEAVLALARMVEDLGLDLLAFQDHPYQPGFLDTWTLLSFLAAQTSRVRLLPDVANVPLRPPAVLARSAATIDILSRGRLELGLGASYFLDAIAAMGGPRRTAAENVDALEEAITVIRSCGRPDRRSASRAAGTGWRGQAGPGAGPPDRHLGGRLQAAHARADRPGGRRLGADHRVRRPP